MAPRGTRGGRGGRLSSEERERRRANRRPAMPPPPLPSAEFRWGPGGQEAGDPESAFAQLARIKPESLGVPPPNQPSAGSRVAPDLQPGPAARDQAPERPAPNDYATEHVQQILNERHAARRRESLQAQSPAMGSQMVSGRPVAASQHDPAARGQASERLQRTHNERLAARRQASLHAQAAAIDNQMASRRLITASQPDAAPYGQGSERRPQTHNQRLAARTQLSLEARQANLQALETDNLGNQVASRPIAQSQPVSPAHGHGGFQPMFDASYTTTSRAVPDPQAPRMGYSRELKRTAEFQLVPPARSPSGFEQPRYDPSYMTGSRPLMFSQPVPDNQRAGQGFVAGSQLSSPGSGTYSPAPVPLAPPPGFGEVMSPSGRMMTPGPMATMQRTRQPGFPGASMAFATTWESARSTPLRPQSGTTTTTRSASSQAQPGPDDEAQLDFDAMLTPSSVFVEEVLASHGDSVELRDPWQVDFPGHTLRRPAEHVAGVERAMLSTARFESRPNTPPALRDPRTVEYLSRLSPETLDRLARFRDKNGHRLPSVRSPSPPAPQEAQSAVAQGDEPWSPRDAGDPRAEQPVVQEDNEAGDRRPLLRSASPSDPQAIGSPSPREQQPISPRDDLEPTVDQPTAQGDDNAGSSDSSSSRPASPPGPQESISPVRARTLSPRSSRNDMAAIFEQPMVQAARAASNRSLSNRPTASPANLGAYATNPCEQAAQPAFPPAAGGVQPPMSLEARIDSLAQPRQPQDGSNILMRFVLKGSTQRRAQSVASTSIFSAEFIQIFNQHVYAALSRGRAGQGLFSHWKNLTWDEWPVSRDLTSHACLHCSDRSMRATQNHMCSWKQVRGGAPDETIYAC